MTPEREGGRTLAKVPTRIRAGAGSVREMAVSSVFRLVEHFASSSELWSRSRIRWQETRPDPDLTWGHDRSGDSFVRAAQEWHAFGPDRSVLEVGPGYGRILRSCIALGVPFKSYCGLDISAANVSYLQQRFGRHTVSFVNGDVETTTLP